MKRWFLFCSMAVFLCQASTGKPAHFQHMNASAAALNDSVFFYFERNEALAGSQEIPINLYYHDSLGYGHPVSVTPEGLSLFLTHPTFFIQPDEKQTPFLVYPGERIHIRHTTDQRVSMYVEGNLQRTNELAFFSELVKQTDNLSYAFRPLPHLRSSQQKDSVWAAERMINTITAQRMAMLSASKDQLSERFFHIAGNAIRSAANYDSLVLYWNNKAVLGDAEMRKKIAAKAEDFRKLEFLPYIFNTRLSNAYAASLLNGNPNYVVDDSSNLVKMYQLAAGQLTGPRADFVLTRLLLDSYNKAINVTAATLSHYYAQCGNDAYKEIVKRKLTEAGSVAASRKNANSLRWSDGKTIEDLSQMLTRYKGKLLVVDFWASWCIPCRAEMPAAITLRRKYAGKPVSFVYISIDANSLDWQNASKQEKLDSSHNYLFLNSDEAPFTRQFGLYSIPRYMLIGKDGKVLVKDAPRPSDPALAKMIDRYLK